MPVTSATIRNRILKILAQITHLLEQENTFLMEGRVEAIDRQLTRKKTLLQALEETLPLIRVREDEDRPTQDYKTGHKKSDNREGLEEAFSRFHKETEKNEVLLRQAIGIQNTLVKMMIVDADSDHHAGYGCFGGYEKKNAYSALTLSSDV